MRSLGSVPFCIPVAIARHNRGSYPEAAGKWNREFDTVTYLIITKGREGSTHLILVWANCTISHQSPLFYILKKTYTSVRFKKKIRLRISDESCLITIIIIKRAASKKYDPHFYPGSNEIVWNPRSYCFRECRKPGLGSREISVIIATLRACIALTWSKRILRYHGKFNSLQAVKRESEDKKSTRK